MDSSVGILFRVITLLVLFLISGHSPSHALQSPFCFGNKTQSTCSLSLSVDYPIKANLYRDNNCGYPGFEVDCDPYIYDGRPFMNISNHFYVVLNIDYGTKQINLMDGSASGGGCPQPNFNFSSPSSPSWVNYYNYGGRSLTVFYNCSTVPADAEKHLHCSNKDTNTPPSYAFYNGETRDGFDWYGNCAKNVVVPAFYTDSTYSNAIKHGFYMGWSTIDWCKDCERSGGQCWSRLDNSNGCACKNNLSFKRTCLPDWCINCESSGGQCWSNSTATVCTCQNGESYNRTCPQQQQTPPLHPDVPQTPSIVLKSPHPKDGLSTGIKIGIGVLSGIGGVLLVALLVFCKRLKHSFLSVSHLWNKKESPIDIEVFLEKYGCLALQRDKYSEIRKMTNSFEDILGQGGYGRVFKGELHDGGLVAVKLNESKGDGEDFINEVATIGRTNHVNVVNLVGFCIEGTRRALVYEFMPNGSLERFIYTHKESSTTMPLGWEKLYQIALGIARGLEYLHRGCNTRILHFDIKPHNILLDQNFCPKISDFGLAKLYPQRESIVSRVGTRGTVGYIAPELYNRTFGNVSHKSDVYSYGMMMLEMTGGRKNIDVTVDNISEIYFPLWIYNHLKQHYDAKGLEEIQATEVFEDEKAKKMILVALWCIQAHPVDRPSMSKVVEMLEGNTHELQMPPNPSVDPRSSYSTSL